MVGAVLLIPIGSLVALGAGTAGAKILATSSKITLGGIGTIDLDGVTVNTTTTTGSAWINVGHLSFLTSTHRFATIDAVQRLTEADIRLSITSITITATAPTTGYDGCKINGITFGTLTKTGTTQWSGTLKSTAAVVARCKTASFTVANQATIRAAGELMVKEI